MKKSITVCVVVLMFLALSDAAPASSQSYGGIPVTGSMSFDGSPSGELDTIAPATITLIPEPATIILLSCGGLVLFSRKRSIGRP